MIDWPRVDELREEVGAEDFHEVVNLFLEEVDEVVERLRLSPDPARFEEDMHFLKGSALNLGFQAFGDLCGSEERRAAADGGDGVDIAPVLECYRASKAAFLANLDADRAA